METKDDHELDEYKNRCMETLTNPSLFLQVGLAYDLSETRLKLYLKQQISNMDVTSTLPSSSFKK